MKCASATQINQDSRTFLDSPRMPSAPLIDRMTVGKTGRRWHLPFDARRSSSREAREGAPIELTREFNDALLIRRTCEFLRQHASIEYDKLYSYLYLYHPVSPTFPEPARLARVVVEPHFKGKKDFVDGDDDIEEPSKRAPFKIHVPEIGKDHWAYKRHHTVGHYCSAASGDPKTLADAEVAHDLASIKYYLKSYADLAEKVTGHNLWRATFEPSLRDPYYTCMELCVGEAQVPSHFLAMIHHGIALHMMHEVSLPWDKRDIPRGASPKLIKSFKNCFRALARMYREDFCS